MSEKNKKNHDEEDVVLVEDEKNKKAHDADLALKPKVTAADSVSLFSNYSLAGYPVLVSATTLATYPVGKVSDFKVGLTYQIARRVGEINTGTTGAPVWEDQFEMINRLVSAVTINQDLLDFQHNILKGNAYNPGTAVAATGITVAPATATVAKGATTTLTGTLAPAGTTNKTVWWTSANPTIATVNAQGVVIGVQAGVVNIYGTSVDGSFVGTSVITVT